MFILFLFFTINNVFAVFENKDMEIMHETKHLTNDLDLGSI